ncbi:MAG: DNA-3-methyladenine glycosylase [Nitrospiraceae bacterium]|nr:DNA-3-methyladenine glycosylase [Nitrospiraceae bacterium]MSR23962.1 DNA-3-methyladenine glycosylase [Nitrospiraceae bacterium]
MAARILKRPYFSRPTLQVARSLLGKYLVRKNGRKTLAGRIVEVEAYIGMEDRACHASKGRTARTEVMFGPAGISYVYLIYGMYHCFNIVTERVGYPSAVLVRAVEDVDTQALIDGPGRVCRFLAIDRRLNRLDLTKGRALWVEDRGGRTAASAVTTGRRIGVDYAGIWAKRRWRFRLAPSQKLKVKSNK